MSRPRKEYPFDKIKSGRAKKFTGESYTTAELGQMIAAAYRRRHKNGTPLYRIRTLPTTTGYVWVEFYRVPESECYTLTAGK